MASDIQTTEPSQLTWEEARSEFGAPSEQDQFAMAPEMPEFRNALPGLATAGEIAAKVAVLEATWDLSPAQNRTIWFIQRGGVWSYLHHMDWDKGTEF